MDKDSIHLAVSVGLLAALPAFANQPLGTWEFDLKTPATYKLQIEHRVPDVALETKVSYTITIGEVTQTRELALIANRPFSPLLVDVPSPRKMRVVVNGLSQAALKGTRIYVYDDLSVPALEVFDPAKHEVEEVKHVRAILEQPEAKIDLARAKLAIDKMIDPSIDIEANLMAIDRMVKEITEQPDFGPLSASELLALQRYVYLPGDWNTRRAFEYDLDDPLGSNVFHKLLPYYLQSRKGNCVTMPILYVILGDRLGLDLTLSTAPKHLLVKFRDDLGTWINLEATSGANPARDVWLKEQFSISDEALANGIFLQPLTRKEAVAVMAMTLAEYYLYEEEYRKAVAISDLVLEYYPKNVQAMVLKGSAYARISTKEFRKKYPTPNQIPPYLRSYFANLSRSNLWWFEKAEALGWRDETEEERERYLQSIRAARKQRAPSTPETAVEQRGTYLERVLNIR